MKDTFDPTCLLNHTMAHAPPLAAGPAVAVAMTGEAGTALAAAPLFHTVEEAARTLGKTIGRRICDGVIRKMPMGGRLVRISSPELQRLAADAASPPAHVVLRPRWSSVVPCFKTSLRQTPLSAAGTYPSSGSRNVIWLTVRPSAACSPDPQNRGPLRFGS
jgi:hypothetical protein